MTPVDFQEDILQGIPSSIPTKKAFEPAINHAPKRKDILSVDEKKLALRNALRYFPQERRTYRRFFRGIDYVW
ncbi:MAG: hypothetical protein RL265_299 [Bacteroidota bacterium]